MLELKKSDSRKVVIGQLMRKKTSLPIKGIAKELKLGAASSVANLLRRTLNESEEKEFGEIHEML